MSFLRLPIGLQPGVAHESAKPQIKSYFKLLRYAATFLSCREGKPFAIGAIIWDCQHPVWPQTRCLSQSVRWPMRSASAEQQDEACRPSPQGDGTPRGLEIVPGGAFLEEFFPGSYGRRAGELNPRAPRS